MHGEVMIREYREEDKGAILEILRLNTPAFFSASEEKDLIYYLDHEIEYYYVIETEGQVIGCGGFNLLNDLNVAKISWDILHPDYQGLSLGSFLLNYRIQKIRELDITKKITVRTSQLVYKFYEKNGFELINIVKNYWANGFDLYEMRYLKY